MASPALCGPGPSIKMTSTTLKRPGSSYGGTRLQLTERCACSLRDQLAPPALWNGKPSIDRHSPEQIAGFAFRLFIQVQDEHRRGVNAVACSVSGFDLEDALRNNARP